MLPPFSTAGRKPAACESDCQSALAAGAVAYTRVQFRDLRSVKSTFETCSDKLLTKVVFLARLLPMVSFDLVIYAAGLTRLSPVKFLAASALGMLPRTFLLNALGHTAVFDARVTLLAGAIVAVLFLLLPCWIEQRNPSCAKTRPTVMLPSDSS